MHACIFFQVLGTFDSVAKTVKATLTESLVRILSPKRRVDILRDCLHAKQEGRPYVMAFCGVSPVWPDISGPSLLTFQDLDLFYIVQFSFVDNIEAPHKL